jgi:hypothetical protein
MRRSATRRLGRVAGIVVSALLVLSAAGTASASIGALSRVSSGPNPTDTPLGTSVSYDVIVRNLPSGLGDAGKTHSFAVTSASGLAGVSLGSSPCIQLTGVSGGTLSNVVVQTDPATTPLGWNVITLTVTEFTSDSSCSGSEMDTRGLFALIHVTKGTQTITFDAIAAKTYGDPAFALGATASSGLAVSYSASGSCSESGGTLTITGVVSCSVTASQAGDSRWLAAAPVTQSFVIDPAVLTVTANDDTKVQGSANPSLSAGITGFVLGETEAVLTTAPSCATTAVDSSPLGDYPITCSGASATNYTFTYVPGTLHVVAGDLARMVISPKTATIGAGGTQAYTAEGFDANDNSRGDVTAETTFTIDGGTACPAAVCTSSVVGDHTVTGNDGGFTDTAALHVEAGAPHHIVVSPNGATIATGDTRAFSAELFDENGNSLGDVTGSTTFSIDGVGPCAGAACGTGTAGDFTVTGVADVGGLRFTGTATLHVTEAEESSSPNESAGETSDPTAPPTGTAQGTGGGASLAFLLFVSAALGCLGTLAGYGYSRSSIRR